MPDSLAGRRGTALSQPRPQCPIIAIFGLASNHGFIDGNKRTASVTGRLFLAENGRRLSFEPLNAVQVMEGVAAGRVSEADLAAWLRARMRD